MTVRQHYQALAGSYDQRANQTCELEYRRLVTVALAACDAVLEIGAGSSRLLSALPARLKIACDLSPDMLRHRSQGGPSVCADAAHLPFADGSFDGVFSINLLEHVEHAGAVFAEAARVLRPGGRFFAVTPNQGWERLLDLAERLRLKLPEGPHRFLSPAEVRSLARERFAEVATQTFMVLPAGPPALSRAVERLLRPDRWQAGFLQWVLATRA